MSELIKSSDILSGQDAINRLEAIENSGGVTNHTSIAVLGSDGIITIICELDFAKKKVQEGASILIDRENVHPPAAQAMAVFKAAQVTLLQEAVL